MTHMMLCRTTLPSARPTPTTSRAGEDTRQRTLEPLWEGVGGGSEGERGAVRVCVCGGVYGECGVAVK